MRILIRLIIVAALSWVGVVLYMDARAYQTEENPDQSKIVLYFAGITLVGAVVGTVVAVSLIPTIGDALGNMFFNPNQEVEKDPHSGAMAKVAQGDYEGAIEEYRKAFEKDPNDTLALSEIAHFYCDKLHNYD